MLKYVKANFYYKSEHVHGQGTFRARSNSLICGYHCSDELFLRIRKTSLQKNGYTALRLLGLQKEKKVHILVPI